MNSQASDKYKNAFDFIKKNFSENRVRGFYKGFGMTAMKDVVFGSTFLGTYNTLKEINGNENNYKRFFNGSVANATSWIFFIPIDFIKTKVQTGTNITISSILKSTNGNYSIMWKGVIPAVLRTVPVSGFGMIAYELTNDFVKKQYKK